MQIKQQSLLDLMGTPGTQFTIPVFQRAYSWDTPQCEELWRDLLRAARAHRSHFMGTLIYFDGENPDGHSLSVVDGQQRLTTVTLILAALARRFRESGSGFFGVDADFIEETFLRGPSGARLQLSPADRATLEAIACQGELPPNASKRVIDNFDLFKAKIDEPDFDAAELWQGLDSLVVIAAELDDSAQAPAVFESFNSKGVPLVTADLVRNYLLIAESHAEQKRLFEQFWEPITNVFGDDPGSLRLNNAILGWLAVRLKKVRKMGEDQAFNIFKSFCEDEYDGTVEALFEELYSFCLVWAEHYRYHAVKKYKTANWAKLGRKTRVSDRPLAPLDNPESREYYTKHFGVDPQW